MKHMTAEPLVLDIGDWPGGQPTAMKCLFPDAVDGGLDLALPPSCAEHNRTIWWCLNAAVLWCDGGPPDYAWHIWPYD
jgi:hypothetical protein